MPDKKVSQGFELMAKNEDSFKDLLSLSDWNFLNFVDKNNQSTKCKTKSFNFTTDSASAGIMLSCFSAFNQLLLFHNSISTRTFKQEQNKLFFFEHKHTQNNIYGHTPGHSSHPHISLYWASFSLRPIPQVAILTPPCCHSLPGSGREPRSPLTI